MSGYTVEEPNETPVYIVDGIETEINKSYSKLQQKRFKKVLIQLKDNWVNVYNTLNTMRKYGTLDMEMMNKVYKIYFLEYRYKYDYSNEEKIKIRQQKNYMSKKINKLKNKKYIL